MKFYVSRQVQWPTGDNIVEIAAGGLDRSGPDMLCSKFPDEGIEYTDPREALKVAFAIRKDWHEQLRADACANPDISDEVRIEAGYNLDMIAACEEPTDVELHEWAEKEWEAAPKCGECGEVVEESYYLPGLECGLQFCSEYCADKYYASFMDSEEDYAERYG